MKEIKNAIAMLANNITFIKYMIGNIDEEAYKDVLFVLFNDTRIGDKTEELEEIMNQTNLKYKIFTDDFIIDKYLESVPQSKKVSKLVKDYALSLKFISVWFIFKFNKHIDRVVLSDDDCIYKAEFVNIFNESTNISQKQIFGSGSIPKYGPVLLDIFRYDVDVQSFNSYLKRNKINSGMMLFCRESFNIKEYERTTFELFSNDVVHNSWYSPRRTSVFIGSLDEVYLTGLFYNSEDFCFDDKKTNYNFQWVSFDKTSDATLINNFCKKASIHVCIGKDKYKGYNKLIDLGLIKGEKNSISITKKGDLYV